MRKSPDKRISREFRKDATQRRLARFEVVGLKADRHLIRTLAKRLAEGGPDAARIRDAVRRSISRKRPKKGGIFLALRRSPLVNANLVLTRPVAPGRKVDL